MDRRGDWGTRTSSHANAAFSLQLPPDLVSPVDLQVGVPNPLNVAHQDLIALPPRSAKRWIPPLGRLPPTPGGGDLQYLAERLDPAGLPVLIDAGPDNLQRWSSSAWAQNTLAQRRISLALRSSRTSRSSALIRSRSAVLRPSR